MKTSFAQLQEALTGEPAALHHGLDRTPRGERLAAVLLLLSQHADPEVTFVTRAETMRQHAGQIALPGGAADPGDGSARFTALREAHEEIGLHPEEVTVLGELPPLWVPASRYDVATVIGTWAGARLLGAVDPCETGQVHAISVSTLASPEVRVMGRHPRGFIGPAFAVGDNFIWGLTGHLVDWVLNLAGWDQQWDHSRVVDVPERFLRS